MNPQLLTANEAAQLKGVTIASIYAAVKEDRLPHTRVLRRIGLNKADVLAWVPRAYAGRPGTKSGRPKGTPLSENTKKRISQSQKRRWAKRKTQK